ncbi:MAG: DUF5050 domain-containing protein [Clostridia bacterium]|nr:DUF5050 domain-containing protein [Clostridia bacterium]
MKKVLFIILCTILLLSACGNKEVKDTVYEYQSIQTGNTRYYIDQKEPVSILKTTGNETLILFKGEALLGDILLYNNKIYYCEALDSNLYVMDIDGNNNQKILDCNSTEGFYGGDFKSWYIYNGDLYLHSSMQLYKIDLETYQWEIFNNDVAHYQIYNDNLYFINHAESTFTIYKQDLQTKELEVVLGEDITYPTNEVYSNFVIASDGTFYITQRTPEARLISYKDGNIEVIESYEDFFANIKELSLSVVGNDLYYVKASDDTYKLYRYNSKTKQVEEIHKVDGYQRTAFINENSFYYYNTLKDLILVEFD